MEKCCLFSYEWPHPGEWEDDAQKPEIPDDDCVQVTDYKGQNLKILMRGSGLY